MMSIALDRVESVFEFERVMARASVFKSPVVGAEGKSEEEECQSLSGSSSSSSIGRNSDDEENESDRSGSGGGDCEEEDEVQSCCKGSALDMMDSLEQVLPIKRGISSFYNGKSRNYTSLADAVTSPSIKEEAERRITRLLRKRDPIGGNRIEEENDIWRITRMAD